MKRYYGRTIRTKTVRGLKAKPTVSENKETEKTDKEMDKTQIEQMEAILANTPKKVKVEKRKTTEKGLYERAEVTVVTDDNKMLLKD